MTPDSLGKPGSWPSPISAELVAAGGIKINEVKASHGQIWWLETRPADKGRSVVVSAPIDGPAHKHDRLPAGWSSRSRVHEYGGGSWWLGAAHLYFVSAEDQRIYAVAITNDVDSGSSREIEVATEATPITPKPLNANGWCHADGEEHPDGSVIVCVREDHHLSNGQSEPVNEIVVVPVAGGDVTVLIQGADFYQCPRISPDGRWISWVEWNHPNMPWQQTSLKVAPLFGNGSDRRPVRLGNVQTVVAGSGVHGANWTSDGRLVYSADDSGYWNLYWWTEGTGGQLTELVGAEIGYPPWIFGIQQWVDLGDGRLAATATCDAVDTLMLIDRDGSAEPLPGFGAGGSFDAVSPVNIDSIAATVHHDRPAVAAIAATPTGLPEISIHSVGADADGDADVGTGACAVVRPAATIDADPRWFSTPSSVWFDSDGRRTQAFLYLPPFEMRESRPPLIVIGHGGPTAHNSPALSLKVQYWTSRGFAVADVNYGGSSGFGKRYRDRLRQAWGIIDVDDCINAARHFADSGLIDGERIAIRGSSSGGLTVMLALIRSTQFGAGVSLYGVTDLAALAADTHKFESRYIDWLVGPYPEEAERYVERSPSSQVGGLNTPMLLMQGTEDNVVPSSQAEVVVETLKVNGVPHLYVTFDGEGHGFRRADSLVTSLEVELWFYGRIFGFDPADEVNVPAHSVGLGLGFGIDDDHEPETGTEPGTEAG